ncbi:MAG: CoA transferase [Pseudomonadota bacterium]|nr:CoA transferase [Pseudomonadota bacterium]
MKGAMGKQTASGPLQGLKVIEMAGIGPSPMAAMLLADMGAEVVRIVRPERDADDARDSVLRGRRNVQLDLKTAVDVAALLALIERADVLIEGFRPGVMERLGVGPDIALERNSRLIYGRITGWGQSGPLARTAGHDINYIALTGALACIGAQNGGPVPPLNLVGDYGGGALYLLVGILAALFEVGRSGNGQVVDSAMVDGAASLMSAIYAWRSMGMWGDGRGNNLLDGGAPFYGTYQCSDGGFIAVGSMEQKFFDAMLRIMGLADSDFADRDNPASWPRLRERLQETFRRKTRAEWSSLLEFTDACCAPVLTMSEAPHHAHLAARKTFVHWNGQLVPAPAPRFSRTPSQIDQDSNSKLQDASTIIHEWSAT